MNVPSTTFPGRDRAVARAAIRVIAVAGGKGGVGKTNVAVNLAVAAAEQGQRVLLIDGDVSLANADVLLNAAPRHTLADVVAGRVAIEQALLPTRYGVTLLPGASGELDLTRLDDDAKLSLLAALESLGDAFDLAIVDTPSGVGANTLFFARAAEEVLVVTTPEPTALVDAYATIKALALATGPKRLELVVNAVRGRGDAHEVHKRLGQLALRFLDLPLALVGWLPFDGQLHDAVMHRTPVLRHAARAPVSHRLRHLARTLLERGRAGDHDRLQFFWRQLATGTDDARVRPAPLHSLPPTCERDPG